MSRVTRELSPTTTLDALRKQAKRWLKDIEAGDILAAQRFRDVYPDDKPPKLREVQQALAREFGLASWALLKQEIEDRARSHADRVRLFLEKSAIRYGVAPGTAKWNTHEPDRPIRGQLAARLLERRPEIAQDSIHTAVTAGDIETVRGMLAKDASLADQRGGPDGWTPLLRLAYTRLPVAAASDNAVEIAKLLLDHGASATAGWSDSQIDFTVLTGVIGCDRWRSNSQNDFTVLTGVIGGGEGGQPSHPRAEELARLLLERGVDPLNGQALYNTSLGADDTFWLELLWAESERRGETAKWRGKVPELMGAPLDYLLGNAVPHHPKRAAWLLAHGARGDAVNAYSKEPVIKHALLAGRQDVVDMLLRHGAAMTELSSRERFCMTVMKRDAVEAKKIAQGDPDVLNDFGPLIIAARLDDEETASLVLDLGVSPEIEAPDGVRAMHVAAGEGAIKVLKLLIARGAEIDPFERRFGGSPLSWANYNTQPEAIAVLSPLSRNLRGLCFAGCVERVRELLTGDPSLANHEIHAKEPPLFCLPDDDAKAAELVELLLSFGADPSVRNDKGLTPADVARRNGLEEAAALLEP